MELEKNILSAKFSKKTNHIVSGPLEDLKKHLLEHSKKENEFFSILKNLEAAAIKYGCEKLVIWSVAQRYHEKIDILTKSEFI